MPCMIVCDERLDDTDILGGLARALNTCAAFDVDIHICVRLRNRSLISYKDMCVRILDIARAQTHPPSVWAHTHVDLALELKMHGCHLPSLHKASAASLGKAYEHGVCLSRACHSLEQLNLACQEGMTHAWLSPFAHVPKKGKPLGRDLSLNWVRAVPDINVFLLGGITTHTVADALSANPYGVAIMRAAFNPNASESLVEILTQLAIRNTSIQ